jgi:hypothetical protein
VADQDEETVKSTARQFVIQVVILAVILAVILRLPEPLSERSERARRRTAKDLQMRGMG